MNLIFFVYVTSIAHAFYILGLYSLYYLVFAVLGLVVANVLSKNNKLLSMATYFLAMVHMVCALESILFTQLPLVFGFWANLFFYTLPALVAWLSQDDDDDDDDDDGGIVQKVLDFIGSLFPSKHKSKVYARINPW